MVGPCDLVVSEDSIVLYSINSGKRTCLSHYAQYLYGLQAIVNEDRIYNFLHIVASFYYCLLTYGLTMC